MGENKDVGKTKALPGHGKSQTHDKPERTETQSKWVEESSWVTLVLADRSELLQNILAQSLGGGQVWIYLKENLPKHLSTQLQV